MGAGSLFQRIQLQIWDLYKYFQPTVKITEIGISLSFPKILSIALSISIALLKPIFSLNRNIIYNP